MSSDSGEDLPAARAESDSDLREAWTGVSVTGALIASDGKLEGRLLWILAATDANSVNVCPSAF